MIPWNHIPAQTLEPANQPWNPSVQYKGNLVVQPFFEGGEVKDEATSPPPLFFETSMYEMAKIGLKMDNIFL